MTRRSRTSSESRTRPQGLHDVVELLLLGTRAEHIAGGEPEEPHHPRSTLLVDFLGLDVQLDDDVRIDPQHQQCRRHDVEVTDVDDLLPCRGDDSTPRLRDPQRPLQTAGHTVNRDVTGDADMLGRSPGTAVAQASVICENRRASMRRRSSAS